VIGTEDRRWSIGALARACGVTVRTLHHYDRIGLLTPEARTASGHRRYTERDLRRLYRIRALRALGLSLEEIAETVAEPAEDLRDVLVTQLDGVRDQIAQLAAIRDRIGDILRRIDARQSPEPDQLMTTLELMSMYENYFTPEQRDRLMRRRTELGPEAVEAARTEWAGIVVDLLPHVAANTPVDDPAVADLIRRWDAIGDRMTPPGAAATARRMWRENSADLSATLPWPAEQMTALVAYVDRARQSR